MCEIPLAPPALISKNQQKKQARQARWLENKVALKARRKERKIQKKLAGTGNPRPARRKHPTVSALKVAIDLSLVEHASVEVRPRILRQVELCYAKNRAHEHPCALTLTSYNAAISAAVAAYNPEAANWKVDKVALPFWEHFTKDNLVYLTADSANVLTEFENDAVYVIGAILDHNQNKFQSLHLAEKLGVRHARLCIPEHVKLAHSQVLTINQVFEILLAAHHTKSWKDALVQVIPKRKLAAESSRSLGV